MPTITFVEPDGTVRELAVQTGESLMREALNHDVVGILAECGGCAACATCQVIVAPDWIDRIPAPDIAESSMLDIDEEPSRRLSCQITITDALDGLLVHVPASQH